MKVRSALFVLMIFVATLFVQGCEKQLQPPKVVCNKPYILVGGSCCLDNNDNGVCDVDEKKAEETPIIPEEKPVEETRTEFKLVRGDKLTVAGKSFTLVDFSVFGGKLTTTVNIDGKEYDIYETNKPDIINGLRITPVSVDRLQRYLVIKVEPFVLATDQYLLLYRKDTLILDRVVTLMKVQDDDGISLDVDDGKNAYEVFIPEGGSKVVSGLEITNVEAFYRINHQSSYAIVKIVRA
ncbi:MAG: hypothetical protein QW404_00490 [Candidatus Nanoarchaeia archaeon]